MTKRTVALRKVDRLFCSMFLASPCAVRFRRPPRFNASACGARAFSLNEGCTMSVAKPVLSGRVDRVSSRSTRTSGGKDHHRTK
jgi:hypothetical protein